MLLENERQQIVDTCLYMQRHGLVVGTAGNVSVRVGDLVAISPSGVEYDVMTAADVVVTDLAGTIVDGSLKPSSELPLHLAVYHSGPAMAVTQPRTCLHRARAGCRRDSAVALLLRHVRRAGPVAPFAMFGTDQLAINVAEALRDRSGALMANHGAITTGATLDKALSLLPYLEYICEIQLRAMATGAAIKYVSDAEMEQAIIGMSTYGQPQKN